MTVPQNVKIAFAELTISKLKAKGTTLGADQLQKLFLELVSREFWEANTASSLNVLRNDPDADAAAKAFAIASLL